MLNPLHKGFKAAVRPPDRRAPWKWCEQHVNVDSTSPMPGRWRSDNSPWVRELMEVFADNRITDISVKCAAQSSKTQTIMNLACWVIAESPGPAMWVMAAKDEAKDFVRDRIGQTFAACKPVAEQMLRAATMDFTFSGMPFYFTGAGSPSKLQGKPIRWLFLDEVRNYKPGALPTVLKRTRAYWNTRRLIISTPDKEDDEVDRNYKAGDQRVFHFACPHCQHLQQLKIEQLKAVHPESGAACSWKNVPGAREGAVWNFDKLAMQLRYECANRECGQLIADTPAERKAIARNGKFVIMNPNAPKHRVSFQWNALLPPWVSWRSVVEEFINARAAARSGDLTPLKTFINETLGESWTDELGVIEDFGFLEDRMKPYDFGEPMPDEITRFMAADKQSKGGEHYWYVIRAFGMFGKSRLVTYGKCNSYTELEEVRQRYNVSPKNSVIDCAYKRNEVLRFCAASGWKAFSGDDADFFLIRDEAKQKTFRQCWKAEWAQPEGVKPVAGQARRVRVFRWSNPWVFDILGEFATGLVGEFTIPRQVGREYLKQMSSHQRVEVKDTRGRYKHRWDQVLKDDHLRDCECMIHVAAIASKVIASPRKIDGD